MVDLRKCKPGDKLKSRHGVILTYIGPCPKDDYMDHEVRYPNGSRGTRTHAGFVFRRSRRPEDQNIAEIIPQATAAAKKAAKQSRNRPKNLDKRYGWCRRVNHGVYWEPKNGCPRCAEEERRRKAGQCIARLGHGPGHQSSTYCDVIGLHTVHSCQYGRNDERAYWKGSVYKLKFTGFFDEAPTVENMDA